MSLSKLTLSLLRRLCYEQVNFWLFLLNIDSKIHQIISVRMLFCQLKWQEVKSYSHTHFQRYQVLVETKNSFFWRSFVCYQEVDHSRENLDRLDNHLWRVTQYRSKCKREVVNDTLRQLESMQAARFFENFEDSQSIVDIASNRWLSLLIH